MFSSSMLKSLFRYIWLDPLWYLIILVHLIFSTKEVLYTLYIININLFKLKHEYIIVVVMEY